MRSDDERLQDILDAILQVERYTAQGKEAFRREELIQVWIVHHLQIIGEASNSLSPEFIEKHPDVLWAEIVAFRNILVHEYFRVNLEIVWRIVERDLADLKSKIQASISGEIT